MTSKLFGTHLPRFIAELPETPDAATWRCPTCGLVPPMRVIWPGYNGIRYRKQQCPCQKEEMRKRKAEEERKEWVESAYPLAYNWLGKRQDAIPFRAKTFASFDVSRQPEAYELAQMFVQSPQGTLILHGNFGTGKTHLLASICNEGIEIHRRASLFTTAPKLFNAIQERIQENEGYSTIIKRACSTPLLVLDDIDKAKYSPFREEIYFAIIDERVTAGLPTAISTNRLDDLDMFVGGAVADRFSIGQIAVPMRGESYRKQL